MAFGDAQRLANQVVAQHQPMDVQAFVDDRHARAENLVRAAGKRQHFEVARDDQVGSRHSAELGADRHRGLGDSADALRESAIARRAEVDRLETVDLGDRTGGAAEARQGYPGTACPEHFDPSAHRRIGYVMHKVQDMQHETRTQLGPPPKGMLVQLLLHRNIFGAA